jgi:hypothetical protein
LKTAKEEKTKITPGLVVEHISPGYKQLLIDREKYKVPLRGETLEKLIQALKEER